MHDATGTSSQDYAKIRASKGAPGFDVAAALSPPEVVLGAKENLLEKITEKEVPNLKYTWEKARATLPPVAVIHTLQFDSLLYNKDKLDKPTSWADYWQPEKRYGAKVKGHVINYNPANLLSVYALIHAAELGGGSASNMDPAWALLRRRSPMSASSSRRRPRRRRISRAAKCGSRRTGARAPATTSAAAFRTGWSCRRKASSPTSTPPRCRSAPRTRSSPTSSSTSCSIPRRQRAWCIAYFCSPGRGDITDWPKGFADTQIVTAKQFDSVQLPDLEAIGNNRKDWTLRWQEIMG